MTEHDIYMKTADHHSILMYLYQMKYDYHEKSFRHNEFAKKKIQNAIEMQLYLDLLYMRIPIIILTQAVLEAIINTYLQMKCDAGLFNAIEKVSFLEKWTELPKLFNPDYKIDQGKMMHRRLCELKRERNTYIHYKSQMISTQQEVIHKGSYSSKEIDDVDQFIFDLFKLPTDLLENLNNYDDCLNLELQSFKRSFEECKKKLKENEITI